MSGPITPPLEVTEVDGSPDGRPITKIVVSNGDLSISGRTATIDTSGSTTSPAGSDGQVQYNNSGAFGAGAILSTNKTTTVTINSGASGDATFQMTSDTKSITLLCDTSNKLKVAGALNSFVLDASSATGGITWPDGTTQTTAATGSSYINGMPIVDLGTLAGSGDQYFAVVGGPICGGSAGSFAISSSTFYDASFYVPFVGGFTDDIYVFKFNVEVAASSTNLLVGIYSSSNGLPNALLGSSETVDVTSTGDKEITDPFGGSVSIVEGTLYFVGFVRDTTADAVTLKGTDNPSSGWMPVGTTAQLGRNTIVYEGDDLVLPSSVTQAGLTTLKTDIVNFMYRNNYT